jgi:hypothetical protein
LRIEEKEKLGKNKKLKNLMKAISVRTSSFEVEGNFGTK